MSDTKKSPPHANKRDDSNDSEITREHRALMNQSSVDAEDYPSDEREAQSLVQKDKRRDKTG